LIEEEEEEEVGMELKRRMIVKGKE